MWERRDLKEAAKEVLRRTYWMSVVVALILGFVSGGGGGAGYSGRHYGGRHNTSSGIFNELSKTDIINSALAEAAREGEISETEYNQYLGSDNISELPQPVKERIARIVAAEKTALSEKQKEIIMTVATVVFVIFVIAFTVGLVLSAFVFMPIQVGCYRYFVRARDEEGKVGDVIFVFKDNYMNVVKIMFTRYMKILGWTCLFIIPGIIKSYEYSMIPYLLAENPAMTSKEAFETTRKMMDGNKFAKFVLGLSFIGWVLLGILTCGIGLVFYVNPYVQLTYAELYHTLKELNGIYPLPQIQDIPEGEL